MLAGLRLSRSRALPSVYDAHEDLRASPQGDHAGLWIPGTSTPAGGGARRCHRARGWGIDWPRSWLRRLRSPSGSHAAAAMSSPSTTPPSAASSSGCSARRWRRSKAVCFVGGITPIRGIDVTVDAIGRTEATLVLAGAIRPTGPRGSPPSLARLVPGRMRRPRRGAKRWPRSSRGRSPASSCSLRRRTTSARSQTSCSSTCRPACR